jgi:hypothetical protein
VNGPQTNGTTAIRIFATEGDPPRVEDSRALPNGRELTRHCLRRPLTFPTQSPISVIKETGLRVAVIRRPIFHINLNPESVFALSRGPIDLADSTHEKNTIELRSGAQNTYFSVD